MEEPLILGDLRNMTILKTDEVITTTVESSSKVVVHYGCHEVNDKERSLVETLPDLYWIFTPLDCERKDGSIFAFFRDGQEIYSIKEGTRWDQIIQKCFLFDKSPDVLAQIAEQETTLAGSTATFVGASSSKPLRIFVGGDRSQVGKSSVCLGLLGSLLAIGYKPSEIAYIKPATQCESPQLVSAWCESKGIKHRGVGPIVFYKGFTREYLKGNVGTSQEMLQDVVRAVEELERGTKVVIIDGVGYPAVGSICGVSNADVASALGACVVLVGKSGVGDAVDSYNLNAVFFRAKGVKVLGGIFNRLPATGFYSLNNCKEAVSLYFTNNGMSPPYGFIPEIISRNDTINTPTSPNNISSKKPISISTSAELKNILERRVNSVPGVESEDAVVVAAFTASWCSSCQRVKPTVQQLPVKHPITLIYVDVDQAEEDLVSDYDVSTLPHWVVFKNGAKVSSHTGANDVAALQNQIKSLTSNSSTVPESTDQVMEDPLEMAGQIIDACVTHVDVKRLLKDAENALKHEASQQEHSHVKDDINTSHKNGHIDETSSGERAPKKSRHEIELEAVKAGAVGGCSIVRKR